MNHIYKESVVSTASLSEIAQPGTIQVNLEKSSGEQ